MKTLCWLISGHPSMDSCMSVIDAYVKGGCEGIEWTIPYSNPYIGQAYRFANEVNAYNNCPDMEKHLELLAETRIKYPNLGIFISICKENMQAIGTDRMIEFCKENTIDGIITIGEYEPEVLEQLHKGGIKNITEVSYYMTEAELNGAKNATGYVIMQALPYPEEIEAGYTKERLYECLKTLHEICGERPIYCAQGIRSHEDVKFVKDAGADGFILGSSLFNDYDNLEALSETISGFKKASE